MFILSFIYPEEYNQALHVLCFLKKPYLTSEWILRLGNIGGVGIWYIHIEGSILRFFKHAKS